MSDRKVLVNVIIAFLFGFSFIFVNYVGLPIDFQADYVKDSLASLKSVSASELTLRTLNPLTPSWFYPPNGLMEYMRPLQVLLFQIYHHFFPYSLTPFQITAAFGHGILTVLIFSIIFYWTKRLLFSWLAVILHASFPSNFFIMTSITSFDFQYVVSVLSISALLLFFLLTFGTLKNKVSFLLGIFGWVLTIWIVIKLKSSEKILPFVCLGFIMLRFPYVRSQIGLRRCAVLITTIMMMIIILVIPLRPFDQWTEGQQVSKNDQPTVASVMLKKDKEALSFHWKNGLLRTFFVSGTEFSVLNLRRQTTPSSFTGNLGFFLGCFFWGGVFLMPFILARPRIKTRNHTASNISAAYQHFIWLVLTWFAAIMAGFFSGASVSDVRFLNFAYAPATLLIFLMTPILEANLSLGSKKGLYFRSLLLIMVLFTCATNYIFLSKLIGHFGGIQDATVRAEKDVFLSFYQRKPEGAELYQRHQELESRAVVVDWYGLPDDWFENAKEKLDKERVIYFYARTLEPERLRRFRDAGYAVSFWNRYDFFDAKPLVFKLFKIATQLKAHFGRPVKKTGDRHLPNSGFRSLNLMSAMRNFLGDICVPS